MTRILSSGEISGAHEFGLGRIECHRLAIAGIGEKTIFNKFAHRRRMIRKCRAVKFFQNVSTASVKKVGFDCFLAGSEPFGVQFRTQQAEQGWNYFQLVQRHIRLNAGNKRTIAGTTSAETIGGLFGRKLPGQTTASTAWTPLNGRSSTRLSITAGSCHRQRSNRCR